MRWFLLLTLLFSALAADITVAAASNVRYALEELADRFEAKEGAKIKIVTASSGKLAAQIVHGAPYDVFLSADMKYPSYLYKRGLGAEKPKVYAEGRLIFWSMKIGGESAQQMVLSCSKIALPNPKNAPYGRAAIEFLKKAGLYEEVKEKIVFAQNVSQSSQYILSKAADGGFSAASIVADPDIKGKGNYVLIDDSFHSPILQGALLVKSGGDNKEAREFYAFLFSEEAASILKKYGYGVK